MKSDASGSFQNRQKSGRVGREGKKDWIGLREKWEKIEHRREEKREGRWEIEKREGR